MTAAKAAPVALRLPAFRRRARPCSPGRIYLPLAVVGVPPPVSGDRLLLAAVLFSLALALATLVLWQGREWPAAWSVALSVLAVLLLCAVAAFSVGPRVAGQASSARV